MKGRERGRVGVVATLDGEFEVEETVVVPGAHGRLIERTLHLTLRILVTPLHRPTGVQVQVAEVSWTVRRRGRGSGGRGGSRGRRRGGGGGSGRGEGRCGRAQTETQRVTGSPRRLPGGPPRWKRVGRGEGPTHRSTRRGSRSRATRGARSATGRRSARRGPWEPFNSGCEGWDGWAAWEGAGADAGGEDAGGLAAGRRRWRRKGPRQSGRAGRRRRRPRWGWGLGGLAEGHCALCEGNCE